MASSLLPRLPKRKTKIVATLGPASNTPEIVRGLISAGMNAARLNFSHGTHEEHSSVLSIVREEAAKLGRPVAVFQDLCGPKIRIDKISGNEIVLEESETITLKSGAGELSDLKTIFVQTVDPVEVLKPGDIALLSDGQIELVASKTVDKGIECLIRSGGILRSRSGISFPNTKFELPSLTEKDLKDLEWAVENKVDYVAQSFVGSAKDVRLLRQKLARLGSSIAIIAKIERARGLSDVSAIVGTADAAMVARGDLGLELPLEQVPGAQRLIIETANFAGTPVITATQMLMSMVHELRPTRAEVSDVCTAVRDGTDAVMLSEETAIGNHPVQAVRVLDRILCEVEKELDWEEFRPRLKQSGDGQGIADAVCYAAAGAANKISAAAILACTVSGYTARLMAKYRPKQTLFGTTSEASTLGRMAVFWGVEPVLISVSDDFSTEDEVNQAMVAVRDRYGIKPGSRVIITAGLRTKKTGTTDVMEIREIPRSL